MRQAIGQGRRGVWMASILAAIGVGASACSSPSEPRDRDPPNGPPESAAWSQPSTLFSRHARLAVGSAFFALGQDGPTSSEFSLRVSTDEGASWSQGASIQGATDQTLYRGFAADGTNLFLAHRVEVDGSLFPFLSRSSDGGQSWSAPIQISSDPGDVRPTRVGLALGDGGLHYVDRPLATDAIIHHRSTDGGLTWFRTNLSDPMAEVGTPRVAVDGNRVHVVWQSTTDVENRTFGVFYRGSTDGGATWGEILQLTGEVQQGTRPDVAVVGGVLVVSYDGGTEHWNFPRDYQPRVRRSLDGGTTWGPEIEVAAAPSGRGYSHHLLSSGPGGTLHLVWWDEDVRSAPDMDDHRAMYSFSVDQGETWSEPEELATEAVDGVDQPFALAVTNSYVHVLIGKSGQGDGPQPSLYSRRRFP